MCFYKDTRMSELVKCSVNCCRCSPVPRVSLVSVGCCQCSLFPCTQAIISLIIRAWVRGYTFPGAQGVCRLLSAFSDMVSVVSLVAI